MDKLGWKAGGVYGCHGALVGLRSSTEDGLSELVSWLPRAMTPSRRSTVPVLYSLLTGGVSTSARLKRYHLLYRNFTLLARSLDPGPIERAFKRDVSMFIGEHASRRVFVHAGVVAIGGGAVVIPGRSFSGKTTLTRALVEQGGVYYSDEYAVIDSRGRVTPWSEPLSIRTQGPLTAGEPRTAESLGMRSGRHSLPVRLVVMTSFEKGRRFEPRNETPATGALGLLAHTLPAQKRPRAVLRALSEAVSAAQVIRGPRGEAKEAARKILRHLAASFPA